jgi:hypothetical protein
MDHLDKNDVEVIITFIDGISGESHLKIFAGSAPNERFRVKVRSGHQKDVRTIIKLPEKEMFDVIRGDKPVIVARLFSKGFWGS